MRRLPVPLLIFALTLVFYTYTLQPSLSWGDGTRLQREAITGESYILTEMVQTEFAPDPWPFARVGVAAWDHPLYIVLGHILVRVLPGLNPLWLVNLISGLFGAAAIAVFFQLCFRHTQSLFAASAASLALALSHTFWWHSTTPEVYTLFVFLLLLSLYFYDLFEATGQIFALLASLFCLGLNLSNHLLTVLAFPAALLYFTFFKDSRKALKISKKTLLLAALAFLAGSGLYLIQFARLLRTFPLGEIMGPVVGSTFLGALLDTTPSTILRSMAAYLTYLAIQFSPVGLFAGVYGLWRGARPFPALWGKTIAFYAAYTTFGILYRVTDQFAFLLASHVFFALAIAMGIALLTPVLASRARLAFAASLVAFTLLMPVFYAALPGLLRSGGWSEDTFGIPQVGSGSRDGLSFYINPNKRADRSAEAFGIGTLSDLPPQSIVVAQFYVDTDEYFVLRYFTAVEGLRPDIEIAAWPHEDPFNFDPRTVISLIEAELPERPVYLASLNESYYAVSILAKKYCLVPEANLYRVYPSGQDVQGSSRRCLAPLRAGSESRSPDGAIQHFLSINRRTAGEGSH